MKKVIVEYIIYDDIEEYIIFILKFIVITHLFPILCAIIIAMHQDYLSFFIDINTKNGKRFLDHEEKLEKYYTLKEKEILISVEDEVHLNEQESSLFKKSVKKNILVFTERNNFERLYKELKKLI